MATKTGNSYITGTTTDTVEITTASPGFRPWQARIKCRQVTATMTDNRMWPSKPEILIISGTMTDRTTIPTAIWGFRPRPARRD